MHESERAAAMLRFTDRECRLQHVATLGKFCPTVQRQHLGGAKHVLASADDIDCVSGSRPGSPWRVCRGGVGAAVTHVLETGRWTRAADELLSILVR